MSYRLEQQESVAEGIKRIALEQIDKALSELKSPRMKEHPPDDPDEAIHEARKHFKKVRAVLRIVRDAIGQAYKYENVWYRDAGRQLSSVRDSAVMVETLDDLTQHFGDSLDSHAFKDVRQELVDAHEATRRRVVQEEGAIARVVAVIQEGRERVEDWPIEGNGFSALGDGLKRVYKRGRRALEDASEEPTRIGDPTENLHELRKRAKYLWYHMRILGPSWPQLLEALADEVHTLSDYLGDDHDLALLSRLFQEGAVDRVVSIRGLRDQEDGAERLAALLGLIARRRKELQAAAWPIAERIYVEKPKAFVKRIAGYWRVWQS